MLIIATLSSDLILKSPTVRRNFQRVLMNNIRQAFKEQKVSYEMSLDLGHLFVSSEDKKALEILQRTFGIETLSLVELQCESKLETIAAKGYEFYKDLVKTGTYCVRTKRKGKHDYTSEEVNYELGGRLKTDENLVKIKNPEICIQVYIKDEKTYFFTKKIKAEGGLPLGSGGKALCLMSGGFDSPLASWMMQRRGIKVHYLFCNLGGKAYQRSTLEISKRLVDLWGAGSEPSFYTMNFEGLMKEIREKVKPSFHQVVLKKFFYKAAEYLCHRKKFDAIITGEAIGQVSSQTLKNLRAIEDNVNFPLFRPLISFNKGDIIDMCQKIGTYELSEKVKEFCQISKEKPVTATSPEALANEFSKIDLQKIKEEVFITVQKVNLKTLDLAEASQEFLATDVIPEKSVIIDCRNAHEHEKKPFPGIEHKEPYRFENLKSFSKDKIYVLFCEANTQSLLLAEKMQKQGYTAYALSSGVKGVEKHLQATHSS